MNFKSYFQDNIYLDTHSSRRIKDDFNGYLTVLGNPIAKAGVHRYRESDIFSNGDYDTIVYVYKPFEELVKAKDKFKQKPIVKSHKWLADSDENKETIDHRVDGAIGSEVWDDGKKTLLSDIIIYNPDVIKDIENGSYTDLSPGFKAEIEYRPGVYEGVHYDYVMKNFHFNHLGIVSTGRGRAGRELRILDEDTCMEIKKDSNESMANDSLLAKDTNNQVANSNKSVVNDSPLRTEVNDFQKGTEVKEEATAKFFSEEQVQSMMESFRQQMLNEMSSQKQEISSQKEEMQKFFNDQFNIYKNSQKELLNTKSQVELNIGRPIMEDCNSIDDVYKYGYQALSGVPLPSGLHAQTAYMTLLGSKDNFRTQQVMAADSDSTLDSVPDDIQEMHKSIDDFIRRVF